MQGIGDENTLLELQRLFFLHPLALEDAVNAGHRPSSQVYGNHHLVIARARASTPKLPESCSSSSPQLLRGRAHAAHPSRSHHGDEFRAGSWTAFATGKGPLWAAGPDYLAYALLDASWIDAVLPGGGEDVGDRLDGLEARRTSGVPTRGVLAAVNRAMRAGAR